MLRRGDQKQPRQSVGHGGVDESGFHRHNLYAAGVQPVAQTLQIKREPPLGGAIDVVALPAAVAGDRADAHDEACAAAFQRACDAVQQQRRGCEVDVQQARGFRLVLACEGGVAEVARGQNYAVKCAESTFGLLQQGFVRIGICQIECGALDRHFVAQAQIGGDAFEFVGVACCQEQRMAAVGEFGGGCACDGGSGAHDQHGTMIIHGVSPGAARGRNGSGCRGRSRV